MKAIIHKELTYEILKLGRFTELRKWMFYHLRGERNVKRWFCMPDDPRHYSKIPGEHSYKIDGHGVLHDNPLGTNLIINIKRDSKDVQDCIIEDFHHWAAVEMAKVAGHWISDLSTAPHICFGWPHSAHAKFETKVAAWYKKHSEEFLSTYLTSSVKKIKGPLDIWALNFVKENYVGNMVYLKMMTNGSFDGAQIRVVLKNVVENVKSYLDYQQRYLIKKRVLDL